MGIKEFLHCIKSIPKDFHQIYWPYLCCDFILHYIHDTWMYSVLSSLCVCLQTNLLTAAARHSAIFMLFILCMFVQSIYQPTNALCNTPFMTYNNSSLFQHHGTTLRVTITMVYKPTYQNVLLILKRMIKNLKC